MKKKIFMLALSACLIVLSIAGSSLAYFTDVEEQSTVFTAGNVAIQLEFAQQNSKIKAYPNQEISAPAEITNIGSEDAFVGAIITLEAEGTDLETIISPDGTDYTVGANKYTPVSIREFLKDLVANSNDLDGYTVKYIDDTAADGKTTYTVYVLKNAAVAKGETVKIFDGVNIPAEWDHTEMEIFSKLKLSVKAYATQTVGFTADDPDKVAETALTTAFKNKDGWSGFGGYTALN